MNKQRMAVYGLRRLILKGKDTRAHVVNLTREVLDWYLDSYCEEKQDPGQWNIEGLRMALRDTYGMDARSEDLSRLGRAEMIDVPERADPQEVRGEGAHRRPRADALPPAHDHAPDRGLAVEGPYADGAVHTAPLAVLDPVQQGWHDGSAGFRSGHDPHRQDIDAARADLVSRGVDVSEVAVNRPPGFDRERALVFARASFSDPDGNRWQLQEITTRLPGREWED